MDTEYLLNAEHLTVGFREGRDQITVVKDLSFSIEKGEILGIVGESGSGKSMTALSVMGLLPADAVIQNGTLEYQGKNILRCSEKEKRLLRGSEMSMIFQEPMTSLNPVITIGRQVEEMLCIHTKDSKKERYEKTIDILTQAGLLDPENIYYKYPFQLSGGMRQRVMIAMAMILKPKLLIADEPTTALDVTIQAQILKLIQTMAKKYHTAVIFISHDLGVIKNICTRAIVMRDGSMVEEGTIQELFNYPKEAYTKKLLDASKGIIKDDYGFMGKENSGQKPKERTKILSVSGLNVFYPERKHGLSNSKKGKHILYDITFSLYRGETLGIVGESGSGKTTLAKALTGVVKEIKGEFHLYAERPKMVFQDPYGSLNPAKKVEWILEEPLKIQKKFTKEERKQKVRQMIREVGLEEKHLNRYLSQLSGGQRQRVAIGWALIVHPEVVILDEPVSALDVTVQAQILELLLELQDKYGLSYLLISHDLNVIYQMCDRIGVIYQGRMIELDEKEIICHNPQHSYTKKLIEAVPHL